jgi:pyruvate carboxylase
MEPGEEISVEIDPGKTLEIRCQAIGETNDEGEAKVFFELNGQPRTVRVPDRKIAAEKAAPSQGRARATRPCRRADARRGGLRRVKRARRCTRAICCSPSRR